ncbi:hypothetical protein Scep_014167 [Stephania cephalantha]|uniref:Pentatricopeptide repeat-containing protein n=1 Tax=Stephania cephalantha TaxID=152367 RepID=A0AAP0P2R1_9MAGN
MLLQQQCLSPHNLTPTTVSPTFHQQHRDGNSNPLYCVFNQSRRRRRTAIRGVERESSEFELDKEKAREALRKLDQQLQDLSSRETNQPRKRRVSSSKLDSKTWTSIVLKHAKLKNDQAIVNSYIEMENLGVQPDSVSLPVILKACSKLETIEIGKKIHSVILNTSLVDDVRVRTALVDFYCGCGLLEEATQGEVKPNSVTMVNLLSACSELSEIRLGQVIHCYCLKRGLFDLDPHIGTALISFYSRLDDVLAARVVFDLMVITNVVSWNAMLSGYLNVGDTCEAMRLFLGMVSGSIKLTKVAVLVAIQCCIGSEYIELGNQIHQVAIKLGFSFDLFIVNALISMYGRKVNAESSRQLFETIPTRDVALWNSMMSIYIECGCHDEAFALFARLQSEGVRKDAATISLAILACIESAHDFKKGKSMPAYVIKSGMKLDASIGNALLSMYSHLNIVESSCKTFNEIRNPDVVSWNTLILAMARNKLMDQPRGIFFQMQQFNFEPNSFTMVSLLAMCADEACINIGRAIHAFIIRLGVEVDASLLSEADQLKKILKEDVPEFSSSYLAYSAFALFAFSILYNIFFIAVIKPSVDGP